MLKKRLASAHPEREHMIMTDAQWDALCSPVEPPTTTWTTGADAADFFQPYVEVRVDRVDDQTPLDTHNRNSLFRGTNFKTRTRVNATRGKGSQIWLEDSIVKIDDAGWPEGLYNGGAIAGTSIVASRTHIEGPVDGVWQGDGFTTDGHPNNFEFVDFKGKGFGQMQGYMLASGNWGKPAAEIVLGISGTMGRRFSSDAERASYAVALSTLNLGDTIPAGKFFSAGGRFYGVTQAGPMPVQGLGNDNFSSDITAYIASHTWPGRGPDEGDGGTPDQAAVFHLITKDGSGVYKDQKGRVVSAQPFASGSGTLQLVSFGAYLHCDAFQNIRPGWSGTRHSRFRGWANSAFLNQTNVPPGGATAPGKLDYRVDGNGRPNVPCGGTFDPDHFGLVTTQSILEPLSNQWIYVNVRGGHGGDPIWTDYFPGMYTRSKTAATWTANPIAKQYLSPPWGISYVENELLDRVNANTSNWGTQIKPTMAPGGYPGAIWTADNVNAGPHPVTGRKGDYGVFVKYDKQRRDAIARQFNADGTINTTILEARYQAGIQPNRCDARTWIEWRDNQSQRGEIILPTVRAGFGGFGAHGYLLESVL